MSADPSPRRPGGLAAPGRALLMTIAAAVLVVAACSRAQRLPEYDFRGTSLAAVTIAPPRPDVFGGMDLSVDARDPLSVLRAGAEVAREASLRAFRARLDSAATRVDVAGLMGDRTLDGVARHLRAESVKAVADADHELELRVRSYGIRADSWTSGAHFRLDADLLLLDGASGRIVWRNRVRATEPVRGPRVESGDRAVTSVVTALALTDMSTGEIEQALESLAAFSADALVAAFARALDDAREG